MSQIDFSGCHLEDTLENPLSTNFDFLEDYTERDPREVEVKEWVFGVEIDDD
ncbi:TPA: hypothetical protein LNF34_003566 [Vibrio cholerae]|uniref:hypothetical protein n=1 Tax=Vibrio cholerae TaxID=666 RepID=UPI001E551979|nr:hypothetical protein [Vibrio cholerae]MCD6644660.1 hypothetical protein [Vibrio cholerae]HBK7239936.1 hypothetical protein [Vibrio cholerae]